MNDEKNKAWEHFTHDGKVESYLKYKEFDEGVDNGVKASTHLNPVTEDNINSTEWYRFGGSNGYQH